MALIKCSECGNEASEKATACPKCGNPIDADVMIAGTTVKKSETKGLWKVVVLVIIGLIVYAIWSVATTPQAELQALSFIERFTDVKYRAVDLETKKGVSGPSEMHGLKEGDHRYVVSGTVRCEDNKRYTIRVFVDNVNEGETWRVAQILLGEGEGMPIGRLDVVFER